MIYEGSGRGLFEMLYGHLHGETERNYGKRIAATLTEIQTEHLQNLNLER
jgi:hypothetical protein